MIYRVYFQLQTAVARFQNQIELDFAKGSVNVISMDDAL